MMLDAGNKKAMPEDTSKRKRDKVSWGRRKWWRKITSEQRRENICHLHRCAHNNSMDSTQKSGKKTNGRKMIDRFGQVIEDITDGVLCQSPRYT